jgi:hypothetical protein
LHSNLRQRRIARTSRIVAIQRPVLAGKPDLPGLCWALRDWSAELRIIHNAAGTTDKHAERGISLEAQAEKIRAMALVQGAELSSGGIISPTIVSAKGCRS